MQRLTPHLLRHHAGRSTGWILPTVLALGIAILIAMSAPGQGTAQATTQLPTGDVMAFADPATGLWYVDKDATPFYFGNPGDSPFMGDWNCNGETTPGLYRQSDGYAYLRNTNTQGIADIKFFFGNPSDIPLAGDFNGDGCDTLSLYRPSNQTFYIINKLGVNDGGLGAAEYEFMFGNPGDKPFVGDFDGDGIDEVGLHRESTGYVYFRNTLTTGIADNEFYFGDPGDRFVAGDWGVVDGVDTPAVFRPSNTTNYFRHSNTQGIAESQYVFGQPQFIPLRMSRHVGPPATFSVDVSIAPEMPAIPGLDGGPERPLGAVVAPDGSRDEFVADEIILKPGSQAELDAFLARYGGTIVRDGTARLLPGETPAPGVPEKSGWYIIKIDPSRSTLTDFEPNLSAAGLGGDWVFSSDDAARLSALALREGSKTISPNFMGEMAQTCEVCEHPTTGGGNIDAADWWWMTEDDNPAVPGEQGLSIGVTHAWEYLKYQGYPREGVPYVPVKVAVVDSGFDLDTTTGVPLNGNKDYFYGGSKPLQLDEVDGDWTAGGHGVGFSNCNSSDCWHGQMTSGICCAFARNSWGTAGIANGSEIKTLLIKVSGDAGVIANGVYDAIYNNADVVSMSITLDCNWWCRTFDNGNVLKAYVGSARNVGAIVVSAAGNQTRNISGDDYYPCELSGSVCVGAIDQNANAQSYSNWGSVVDIWAPAGIRTTVTRISAATDANNLDIDELHNFHGTSASTPYVAGVVAMMKMLNGNLYFADVEKILSDTALSSTDSKVSQGYVDAFAAVEAAKPNKPPTIQITEPANGSSETYDYVMFKANVDDPEKPNTPYIGMFPTTMTVSSNRDGQLCTTSGTSATMACSVNALSLGTHVITARATDPFGGTSTDTVTITATNTAPIATITYPATGSAYYTSQDINLRGYGFDPEEVIPGSKLVWTSNISGSLGTGGDFWLKLPAGTHTITLSATDSKGATGTDSITVTVTVGTGYPTAQILLPATGTAFPSGTTVYFLGKGTDPEDGNLTGPSLVWMDSLDGFIGNGISPSKVLSGGVCGITPHDVTLTVTDSTSRSSSHTIQILIGTIC